MDQLHLPHLSLSQDTLAFLHLIQDTLKPPTSIKPCKTGSVAELVSLLCTVVGIPSRFQWRGDATSARRSACILQMHF